MSSRTRPLRRPLPAASWPLQRRRSGLRLRLRLRSDARGRRGTTRLAHDGRRTLRELLARPCVDWATLGTGPVGGDLGYWTLSTREEFEPLVGRWSVLVAYRSGETDKARRAAEALAPARPLPIGVAG